MSLHALIILSYRQLRERHGFTPLSAIIAQECNCSVGEVINALTNELQRL